MRENLERPTEVEIRAMVHVFYDRVRTDPELGPVFEHRLAGRWPEHLEHMVDFWTTVLLGVPRFRGNPVARHHAMPEVRSEHFDRWLELFAEVVSDLFTEPTARSILGRAHRMRLALDRSSAENVPSNLSVLSYPRATP